MAKELPYFKFEPNEWENGNIQILSREDKGLFIDLCAMYWARLGDLPLKLAIQKLCGGNAVAFNSLCEEEIIEVIDGNIYIKFLSEQLGEFKDTSKTNSKNAKLRWDKVNNSKALSERNAVASKSQCDGNAIREEKIIEEKIKENIINNAVFVSECKNSTQWIEVTAMQNKVTSDVVNIFLDTFESHLITMEEQKRTVKEYKEHFTHWMKKQDLSNFRVKSFGRTNQI
jgi:hypothetical protein